MSRLTMPLSVRSPADDGSRRAHEEKAFEAFAGARRHLEAVLEGDPSEGISRKWNRLTFEYSGDPDSQLWIDRFEALAQSVAGVCEWNPRHIQISIQNGLIRVQLGGLVAARSDGKNWKIYYARLRNAIGQGADLGLGHCIDDMSSVTLVSSYFHGLSAAASSACFDSR